MDGDVRFVIRKLRQEDPTRISSGSSDFVALKIFLNRQAKNFQKSHLATTYIIGIAEDDDKVVKTVGYITLTNSEIDVQESYPLEDCPHADQYKGLPAVKIARFLIDRDYRGASIGKTLFNHVLAIIADEIVPRVGCRFIITDAKKGAIEFYKKIGFSLLATTTNEDKSEPIMFLDLFKFNGTV